MYLGNRREWTNSEQDLSDGCCQTVHVRLGRVYLRPAAVLTAWRATSRGLHSLKGQHGPLKLVSRHLLPD